MFEFFGKLGKVVRKLVKTTVVDKEVVEEVLDEIKKTLLQADVSFELTANLIERMKKRCLEEKPPAGLTLREHVLKTIYEELTNLLGSKAEKISGKKIMLVGLFGSGKTTSAAKIARYLQKRGLKPALVCLDYHRPAAVEQLKQLGKQLNVPVFISPDGNPHVCAVESLSKLKRYDCLIFDTAGRNALDSKLASELKKLGETLKPDEVLLVIPADLGKVARRQAEEFNKLVGITGVFVTKLDGTAKAGGALAACSATKAKIKFIGTGEKLDAIEAYDPVRFVSRLLGLGDLQTLLEKVREAKVEPEKVEKIVEGKFSLEDFIEQIEAVQKMGPLQQLTSFLPGFGSLPKGLVKQQEERMKKWRYAIQSMTKRERADPQLINESRIKRIAKGSGLREQDVRELLHQYKQMKKLMKQLGGLTGLKRGQLQKLMKQFGFKF